MKPETSFHAQDKVFWAHVRTISETIGYTAGRGSSSRVRVYTQDEMIHGMRKASLTTHHLHNHDGDPTLLATTLQAYFAYRARQLNDYVKPRLMDKVRAEAVFNDLHNQYQPTRPVPMNRQSGEKRRPMYLTGIVNMLIHAYVEDFPCDFDPHTLTSFTKQGIPLRTLARRVDGCFPHCVDPIAIWEIKEYYHTTTFGSRIADGIYEALLDGLELAELYDHEHITVEHLFITDAYDTWWKQGKSYLCRLIDILHMGYVDEILFGYEVVERLPDIVQKWVSHYRERST
jgi:hypothetical protein